MALTRRYIPLKNLAEHLAVRDDVVERNAEDMYTELLKDDAQRMRPGAAGTVEFTVEGKPPGGLGSAPERGLEARTVVSAVPQVQGAVYVPVLASRNFLAGLLAASLRVAAAAELQRLALGSRLGGPDVRNHATRLGLSSNKRPGTRTASPIASSS